MNKKIRIGSIIAVVLLTLVSFSSVVGYSSVKSNPSNTIITDEYDNATPIVLVLQLITKLRNHKEIQNVESEDDVLQIIEGDEELNAIVQNLKSYDCGCDDATPTRWSFPTICILLYPILWLSIGLYIISNVEIFLTIMIIIGFILDCFWYHVFG